MAGLKDILSDKKIADDVKLNINGAEISVGDLRLGFSEVEKQQSQLAAEREQLQKAQLETAAAWAKVLEEQSKVTVAPKVEPTTKGKDFDYDSDPLFAPFKKQLSSAIEAAEKKAADAIAKAEKAESELNKAAAWAMNKQWQRDYESLPAEFRKQHSLKDVLQHASQQRLVDESNVPDVRRAYGELNRVNELEAMKKQAREEGYKQAREEALLSSIPRSNSVQSVEANKTFGSLDDAIAAAMKDPEILAGLAPGN